MRNLFKIISFYFLILSVSFAGPRNLSPQSIYSEKLLDEEIGRKITALKASILKKLTINKQSSSAKKNKIALKRQFNNKITDWITLAINPQAGNGPITPVNPVFPVYLKKIDKNNIHHQTNSIQKQRKSKDSTVKSFEGQILLEIMNSEEYSLLNNLINNLINESRTEHSLSNLNKVLKILNKRSKQLTVGFRYLTGNQLLSDKITYRIIQDKLSHLQELSKLNNLPDLFSTSL